MAVWLRVAEAQPKLCEAPTRSVSWPCVRVQPVSIMNGMRQLASVCLSELLRLGCLSSLPCLLHAHALRHVSKKTTKTKTTKQQQTTSNTKQQTTTNEPHNRRRYVSGSPITTKEAITIPDAKAAADKYFDKLKNMLAWDFLVPESSIEG